jgi:hypothetical protein
VNVADSLKDLLFPVDDLDGLPGNPRRGDVAAISASYSRFGQRKPIVARRESNGRGVVIAGNHQLAAARELGWSHIAVAWADDLTDDQARAFALADNRTSELGEYDSAALLEIIASFDDSSLLTDAGWSEKDISDFIASVDEAGGKKADYEYVKKAVAPIYEPTGDRPEVAVLCDRAHTEKLLRNIDAADLPDDVAEFLRYAAERHTRFNFKNIAEFYAHADAELQDLMEESALVIIDFKKALEQGYARIAQSHAELYEEENGA